MAYKKVIKRKEPFGRPTKYRPEMCAEVIGLMREGMSLCAVAAKLGIRRETLWDWTKKNEQFSNAISEGEGLSQAWWEEKGRQNLENRDFSFSLWFINMKNRFQKDWKDKHEVEHTGADGGPIQLVAIPKFDTPEDYLEWVKNRGKTELKVVN